MANTTPMMLQYKKIKNEHRNSILFFRLGDFYEMFEQDAFEVSKLLDITLTRRNGVPMCGIPYHAAANYITRLLKAGRKIAICEQTHLSADGKGIARREVTEVITPGTAVEEGFLDKNTNNYLAAIGRLNEFISFAYIDLSTGEFLATRIKYMDRASGLRKEFFRLSPREILIQETLLKDDKDICALIQEREGLVINRYPDWNFDLDLNRRLLEKQLKVANLKGFGLEGEAPEILSAGIILDYINDTSRGLLSHIRNLTIYSDNTFVGLDETSQRNLELVENMQDRSRRHTLLEVLDQSRTSMGSRRLKRVILNPLKNKEQIEKRLDIVDFFYHHQILLSQVRERLKNFFDLERLISRVAMERAHAKDLLAIKSSLAVILSLEEMLKSYPDLEQEAARLRKHKKEIEELQDLLEESILEEPSLLLSEGNLIKRGYNTDLDRLQILRKNARSILEKYLNRERQESGISSLKLKYNRILGYFLEVTKANLNLVPDHFVRRQTLVNGERFTTDILNEKEIEINNASEKIVELERELFLKIRSKAGKATGIILDLCEVIADLDVLQSFAFAATLHGYIRPKINSRGLLKIEEGRHPVVEANLPPGSFIPNNLSLSSSGNFFVLLTGPNMAGKSTFLRQTALIVLMAQIGCFIPAAEANISLTDNIFCRVGATDNLARGESTFLVEMNETANILRSATDKSLIIMDEIGRGTGTNDGLSIAWAVSEYLLNYVRAKTLFATHFHELTDLKHKHLVNLSMEVLEKEGEIVFLKRVRPGPSDNSYGIHVAKLAGVPEIVIIEAAKMLSQLTTPEKAHQSLKSRQQSDGRDNLKEDHGEQPLLFSTAQVIQEEILNIKLESTTPLEALNRLAYWQNEIKKQV
ncbi:MAG: DNA mismatch repair protein MutS [Spirochaeta sp.]|nr:DNA mismatch repair protein MutS [Spirochaeta sp.]